MLKPSALVSPEWSYAQIDKLKISLAVVPRQGLKFKTPPILYVSAPVLHSGTPEPASEVTAFVAPTLNR